MSHGLNLYRIERNPNYDGVTYYRVDPIKEFSEPTYFSYHFSEYARLPKEYFVPAPQNLVQALVVKDLNTVKSLIDEGENPNVIVRVVEAKSVKYATLMSLLGFFLLMDHYEMAKFIVTRGANINFIRHNTLTDLFQRRENNIFRFLIEHGLLVDSYKIDNSGGRNRPQQTLLSAYVKDKNLSMVQFIAPTCQSAFDNVFLYCITPEHCEISRFLIQYLSTNQPNRVFHLWEVVTTADSRIVHHYFPNLHSIPMIEIRKTVQYTILVKSLEVLTYLHTLGGDILKLPVVGNYEDNTLRYAISRRFPEGAVYILQQYPEFGLSQLDLFEWAIEKKLWSVVKQYFEIGVDVNYSSYSSDIETFFYHENYPVFIFCLQDNQFDLCDWLIEKGFDFEGFYGKIWIELCCSGRSDLVDYIWNHYPKYPKNISNLLKGIIDYERYKMGLVVYNHSTPEDQIKFLQNPEIYSLIDGLGNEGQLDEVRYFFSQGLSFNEEILSRFLIWRESNQTNEIMLWLLTKNLVPSKYYPKILESCLGSVEIVQWLINQGVDPNLSNLLDRIIREEQCKIGSVLYRHSSPEDQKKFLQNPKIYSLIEILGCEGHLDEIQYFFSQGLSFHEEIITNFFLHGKITIKMN